MLNLVSKYKEKRKSVKRILRRKVQYNRNEYSLGSNSMFYYRRDQIMNQIYELLRKQCNMHKLILFGSWANGTIRQDSDLDLVVILDEYGLIASYKQKMEQRLVVRTALREVNRNVPIDILVYTVDEWKKLLQEGSSFHQNIEMEGVHYEASYK